MRAVRVEVVRSGGFAGRVLRWEVELDALPAETAQEVRSLLDEAPRWADPAGEQSGGRPGPGVPDGFRWRVLSDGPGLDVAFGEPGPEPAQRLVDLVRGGSTGVPGSAATPGT